MTVEVFNWSMGEAEANVRLQKAVEFLAANHPEFGIYPGQQWTSKYLTYAQIIIVMHYTFLNDEWELRYNHHVSPDYPWSNICLRKRNATDRMWAVHIEPDGITAAEIPVSEFATMFGY